jgi:glycosyltransferase involved in cell wall biosynthesis
VAGSRVAVFTSHRAVSLVTVASHIAGALEGAGHDVTVYRRYVAPADVKRVADAAVVVMTADPILAVPWLLLARDLSVSGVPAVYYATVEGEPDRSHVARWMSSIRFVANSEYTASKLRGAGLPVRGVIHHGVDLREVERARGMARHVIARLEYLGLLVAPSPDRNVVAVTAASGHPRKGLDRLAQVARIVLRREPRVRFLAITDDSGAAQLEGVPNVTALPVMGGLRREEVLALIAAGHVYVQPSLAEGFCLPVLEAHALGVPAVHADLPPLREYSVGWRVPVRGVRPARIDGGIVYELHEYDAGEFAEVLLQVADLVMRNDSAVDDYRARALRVAQEHDIRRVYPGLLDALETPK